MNELQKKGDNEIKKMLDEKKEALRVLRFNVSGAKAQDTKEFRKLKKEVARLLTETNARAKQKVEAKS